MKKTILGILIMVMGFSVFANESDYLIKGKKLHNEVGKGGNEKIIEECKKILFPYIETDMTARAYYGSAVTMEAGFIANKNPMKALELLEQGSKFIDEAVEKDPENFEIKILRLSNGISVSSASPYKRYFVIQKDVKFFENEKNISKLDDETKALVYLNLGLFKIEEGDLDTALDYLETAVEVAPASESGKTAEKVLARYEE